MDLRCGAKMHARLLIEEGLIEVKCSSKFCGGGPGVVVLHLFDATDGELVRTDRFKDPGRKRNHASGNIPAVRSA